MLLGNYPNGCFDKADGLPSIDFSFCLSHFVPIVILIFDIFSFVYSLLQSSNQEVATEVKAGLKSIIPKLKKRTKDGTAAGKALLEKLSS